MELFETMIHHTSVRSFTEQALSSKLQQKLILAAQSASSSNFLQAFSIVKIADFDKRKQIEEIANFPINNGENGELYIFIADLNKHARVLAQKKNSLEHVKTMESLVVAIVDAALAAQSMAIYAESVGLGICYVGGIRNNLVKMKDLLKLPELTYPVFGLFVGYPAKKNDVKPRMPIQTILGTDHYQPLTAELLKEYEENTAAYYHSRSTNIQETNWSEKVQQHFNAPRRTDTVEFLKKQGFIF